MATNGFNASFRRSVRWSPVDGTGIEHLTIDAGPSGVVVDSLAIGERGGQPYGMHYRIKADALWRTLGFSITATDGRRLSMRSDGRGRWHHADGQEAPEFDGAIDIDLAGTPFTNTLPIRRHPLGKEEACEFRMLYVPFDTLKPQVDEQRYTCLEPWRTYLYEAVDRSFAATLCVDGDGLVTDYPTLFRRIP